MKEINIIFFDGYCNICDGFVSFLLLVDSKRRLRFASLQGSTAKDYGIKDTETVTFVSSNNIFYDRSDAILEILAVVFPIFSFLFMLLKKVFPKSFRDYFYNYLAKNRYKLFGKKEKCRMPLEEEKACFLP